MRKKGKREKPSAIDRKALTNNIIEVFSASPKKPLNTRQLTSRLLVTNNEEKKLINELLTDLTEKKVIEELGPGSYKLKSEGGYVLGKIRIKRGGYANVISETIKDEIFISQNNLNHALDGDSVKVFVYAHKKAQGYEGEVVEILERSRDTFVGTLEVSRKFAFLSPDSRKISFDMYIPSDKLLGATNGQRVIARITEWPKRSKNPFGEVIEVLGDQGNNEAEMHAILAEYGLPHKFPDVVEEDAAGISDHITEGEIRSRRDFRNVPTFTIDPEDAKDFDDALSVREVEKDKWEVGIHIADVTHYVKEGSLSDIEGQERGTSVYLTDRVVPMLPERLSNYICSLRPNEDKLCFSAVFILNDKAEVIDEWFGRTVINSDKRFDYLEAQKIIDSGEGDMIDALLKLNEIAKILREKRYKAGAIDFEREEIKIEVDENGKPVRVYAREFMDTNKLIEEFMLLANKRVATFIGDVKDKKERKNFNYVIC